MANEYGLTQNKVVPAVRQFDQALQKIKKELRLATIQSSRANFSFRRKLSPRILIMVRTSSVSGTTRFLYDGADVVRDLDGTNSTIVDYLNEPGIDSKLRQATGSAISYFLTNHLGSTVALTDASGNITSSVDYDSFGNVASGSGSTRYFYTGREIDSETGLMYYRARWYESLTGRLISEDLYILLLDKNGNRINACGCDEELFHGQAIADSPNRMLGGLKREFLVILLSASIPMSIQREANPRADLNLGLAPERSEWWGFMVR